MDQGNPEAGFSAAQGAPSGVRGRIVWIDIARGIAIAAMAIYHFAWDLQNFGYIAEPAVDVGGWKLFARADASSFIVLVGVSLVLAHHRTIRWRAFLKRLAMILAAAAAITAVTYFMTPQTFIYFGILHSIALCSLVGLMFLRLPPWLTLIAAVAALLAPWFLTSSLFDPPVLWFVGLSETIRPSNDYVPLLPWLAPLLAGIALARISLARGWFDWLRAHPARANPVGRALAFSGRHSLSVYLLHQPLLFGLVYLASLVVPAPAADPVPGYLASCQSQCTVTDDAAFCRSFCTCTVNELLGAGIFNDVIDRSIDIVHDPRVHEIAAECTRDADQPAK